MLQKLWKTYYYGSSGYDYSEFSLKDNECRDSAYYELLSLNCFSTRRLKIYFEGGELTRYEKQQDIADNVFAQKYLHVCTGTYYNCNICPKCRRTLLSFDAMGKLEQFADVFDLKYYKAHRKEYLQYLLKCHERIIRDDMLDSAFEILKDDPEMREIMSENKYVPTQPAVDCKQEYEKLKGKYTSLQREHEKVSKAYAFFRKECDNILKSKTFKTVNLSCISPKR